MPEVIQHIRQPDSTLKITSITLTISIPHSSPPIPFNKNSWRAIHFSVFTWWGGGQEIWIFHAIFLSVSTLPLQTKLYLLFPGNAKYSCWDHNLCKWAHFPIPFICSPCYNPCYISFKWLVKLCTNLLLHTELLKHSLALCFFSWAPLFLLLFFRMWT